MHNPEYFRKSQTEGYYKDRSTGFKPKILDNRKLILSNLFALQTKIEIASCLIAEAKAATSHCLTSPRVIYKRDKIPLFFQKRGHWKYHHVSSGALGSCYSQVGGDWHYA